MPHREISVTVAVGIPKEATLRFDGEFREYAVDKTQRMPAQQVRAPGHIALRVLPQGLRLRECAF